jgi:hypothetical protein
MFHLGKKIKYQYVGNPYKFDPPEARIRKLWEFDDWDNWISAILLCNVWGEMPRKPMNYEGRSTECDGESNTCTARKCEKHLIWKKITGYFPDQWTIRHHTQGWDVEYKRDPSNIHYVPNSSFLKKYVDTPEHQAMHWSNCIIGACKKHYNLKMRHSYVPTWRQWHERMLEEKETLDEDEQSKDQTLQPRGC